MTWTSQFQYLSGQIIDIFIYYGSMVTMGLCFIQSIFPFLRIIFYICDQLKVVTFPLLHFSQEVETIFLLLQHQPGKQLCCEQHSVVAPSSIHASPLAVLWSVKRPGPAPPEVSQGLPTSLCPPQLVTQLQLHNGLQARPAEAPNSALPKC